MESEWKGEVINHIDALREDLIHLSREIHANPESCFKEFKSSKIVSSFLERNGFNIQRGVGGLETAFKATAPGSQGNPVIAFMAEYDAVPGVGHGCGHNLSCMASVGAGIAVSKLLNKVSGSIIVMGTPAEEGGGGKIIMLEKGVFDGIDVAMMVHACNYTKIEHDFNALSGFRFHFKGRTAHASAAPFEGINASDAVVLTYSAIGLLRQQMKGDQRIHLQIKQDEGPMNMIPGHASCTMVLRAPTGRELEGLIERVKKCAEGGAVATGCELQIDQTTLTYQHMKFNHALNEMFLKNLNILGIAEEYPEMTLKASTDAGNVSQVIPTLHPMIAICGPEVSPHTKEFEQASKSPHGEEVFLACAKAMAMTAVEILASPQAMARIRKSQ